MKSSITPFVLSLLTPATLCSAQQLATPFPPNSTSNLAMSSLFWADYDGDGLLDAFAVTQDGAGRLLRNTGRSSFQDVTVSAGLSETRGAHMAAWADITGDGLLDLFLPSYDGASRLMVQTADGAFVDVTETSGLPEHAEPIHADWFDFDADGNPDLHLVTIYDELVYRGNGRAQFAKVDMGPITRSPIDASTPRPTTLEDARAMNGLEPLGPTTSQPIAICGAPGIQDMVAPATCINASSTPMMGLLFPLTIDLNVSGVGNVGIGTATPAQKLHVVGNMRADRLISTVGGGTSPLSVNSATLVSNLNADLLDGLNASAFRAAGTPIGLGDLAANSVDSGKVVDNSLTANDLAVGSVGASEIATGAVGFAEMGNNAIGSAEVIDGSLTASDLAANSVGSSEITTGAVGSLEITANAVGNSEMNDNAIGSAEVIANSLTSADLGTNSVGASEIAPNSVFSSDIVNNTIVNADVSADAAITGTKVVPIFGNQDLVTNGTGTFGVGGLDDYQVKGASGSGPTNGYLGVSGTDNFDGDLTLDIFSKEVGVLGLSTGSTTSDNFGVLGHSNRAGVRGQHTVNSHLNFAELGTQGVGIVASGTTNAAVFNGDTQMNGELSVTKGTTLNLIDAINTGVGSIPRVVNVGRTLASVAGNDIFQIQAATTASTSSQLIEAQRGTDIEFRVDVDGDLFVDGGLFGGGADYAEMIQVSTGAPSVEAGDLMEIDPTKSRQVRISSQPYSRLVAGIYSTKPGFIGSEREWDGVATADGEQAVMKMADATADHDEIPLALVGIVPCKVTNENGAIRAGDLLVTSSTAGHAMVDNNPPLGTVIGKALESFSGASGTIKVLVTLQ